MAAAVYPIYFSSCLAHKRKFIERVVLKFTGDLGNRAKATDKTRRIVTDDLLSFTQANEEKIQYQNNILHVVNEEAVCKKRNYIMCHSCFAMNERFFIL